MPIETQRRGIPFDIRECLIKFTIMVISIVIGIWISLEGESYDSFYIASLLQAINNMYDSFGFLNGYSRFTTTFHVFSFLGALLTLLLSIMHFVSNKNFMDTYFFFVFVIALLSIPILYLSIEIYVQLRYGKYWKGEII